MLSTVASYACGVWYIAIWSVCLLGCSIARAKFLPSPDTRDDKDRLKKEGSDDVNPERVSILRPLAGLDCNLFDNLCSSFEQRYPPDAFEVILSVKSTEDTAYAVAKAVRERYPHIRSRIIVGDENAGVNPKINNLVRPYSTAAYDIIWVVDSQIWSPPGALAEAVRTLTSKPPKPLPSFIPRSPHGTRVGLVHHVPFAINPSTSWASQVERAFLSTTHAKMYLAINSVVVDSCIVGKSNMYRKSDLDRIPDQRFGPDHGAFWRARQGLTGGDSGHENGPAMQLQGGALAGAISSKAFSITAEEARRRAARSKADPDAEPDFDTAQAGARPLARFGIYLAEDNMLGLALWNEPLHLAHVISSAHPAHMSVGELSSMWDYAHRRMRWIRVRRWMTFEATMVEPITESIVAGLMGWRAWSRLVVPVVDNWLLHHPDCPAVLRLLPSIAIWGFLPLHFAAWYKTDRLVLEALSGGKKLPEHENARFFWAWCTRELLALPIWFWAMCGSTVNWRGTVYQILQDSRAAKVKQ
ncbi:Ceramide glucosyltransferase [Tilletia horrida]|nr:Ceramide glucosyltransferase [Tilletia horrida]